MWILYIFCCCIESSPAPNWEKLQYSQPQRFSCMFYVGICSPCCSFDYDEGTQQFWLRQRKEGRLQEMENNDQIFRPPEQDFLLQWGNRKRLRCVKVQVDDKIKRTTVPVYRRVIRAEKENPSTQIPDCPQPNRLGSRNSQTAAVKTTAVDGIKVHMNGHSSPEKNDRFPLRGNNGCSSTDDTNKISTDADTMQDNKVSNLGVFVWPKFIIALSSKEKEEDFMAIKGSKLPLRPKKRSKFIQRALHLVSPGSWLCELSQDRYEVREKKSTKKRPRGLKAMGNFETDSD